MMIDFALAAQREQGMSPQQAIRTACLLRLRPILMTSIAFIMGVVPLVLSSGAGAEMRHAMGVVVVFGVALSTLLSLFVVPAFYAALARYTRSPEELAHRLDALEAETPQVGGHA